MSWDPSRHVLVLYDARTVGVPFVMEHLSALARHSAFIMHYLPATSGVPRRVPFEAYDAIIIHFSVRLPFEWHLDADIAAEITQFSGLKIAMPQDEYDLPHITARRLKDLGISVLFTTVPPEHVDAFYPPELRGDVEVHHCLTSYVCERDGIDDFAVPMAERQIVVGYRGRSLPVWYGALAAEKAEIGVRMREFCQRYGIVHDIEIDEGHRIYGDEWFRYLGRCRAVLGSESGSNVLDTVGDVRNACRELRERDAQIGDDEIYERVVAPHDGHVLMNQISPKVFEAVRLRTGLILFEGKWSGVLEPDLHYIALKKDWSNIESVLAEVSDVDRVAEMVDRAYRDVVESGRYSYATLVGDVDAVLRKGMGVRRPYRFAFVAAAESNENPLDAADELAGVTFPSPMSPAFATLSYKPILKGRAARLWQTIPETIRRPIILVGGRAAMAVRNRLRRLTIRQPAG